MRETKDPRTRPGGRFYSTETHTKSFIMTKRVAVIGLNGELGQPVLKALTSSLFGDKYQFPIHAITRNKNNTTDTDKIKHFEATLDDEESLKRALTGVDVLISLIPPGMHDKSHTLIKAAGESGVKVYFPSDFDVDDRAVEPWPFPKAYRANAVACEYARSLGMKTVEIKTGVIGDWFVKSPVLFWNNNTNIYKKIDDGDQRVAISFNNDIANVIASLAHREAGDIPDVVRMQSDNLMVNEIVAIYEKAKGCTLGVDHVKTVDIVRQAEEIDAKGVSSFEDFITIYQATVALGLTDHSGGNGCDTNKDNLWQWTKFEPYALAAWAKKQT